ncbi:MAG: di-trans,poly-cis-decaprenylcistransferase [Deltaproteobacteria bacterium]|nr:di-trans,poly-cis-decaprenylcistransferase [Deltaproteobacteria bacterium]
MDGNGRWAEQRSLPRLAGHKAGVESVRETVRTCRELGIPVLTLYAFSRENWSRPHWEVKALMGLLTQYLRSEIKELKKNGIALKALGELEKLPPKVQDVLARVVRETAAGEELVLNLALSYSGRAEILQAVRRLVQDVQAGRVEPGLIDEPLFSSYLYTGGLPDPDLLVRTSGEFRLSDFLTYQLAYAEIYVTKTFWPDFRKKDLLAAIGEYQNRERRFGLTGEQLREKKVAPTG